MNIIDKAISVFSPNAGLRRQSARAAIAIQERFLRRYEGASQGRRTKNWFTPGTSANSEVDGGLRNLVNRSRDLVRNNPYASRAVTVIASNVVGTGIIPNPTVSSKPQKKRIKDLWWNHFETTAVDADGNLDIYGLQALWIRTVAESGEVLIIRRRLGDFPLRLQTLECDYLDTSKDTINYQNNGNFIIHGIEYNQNGERVAYHLFKDHPGDRFKGTIESRRIPATDVIHIYRTDRPGQGRGIPWAAPVLLRLRDLDEYEDAQLTRQKIATCFAAFIQQDVDGTSTADNKLEKVEPGIVQYLAPGETVTFANPPGTEGYDAYTKAVLRSIAVGYGVTVEALTGNLSDVNFSSGRMGWLEFQRNLTQWQNNLMLPALNKVWSWFMETTSIMGVRAVPTDWTMPRREMIQPKEELEAMRDEVRNGFTPWQEQVRKLGGDPDDVITKMVDDQKSFDDNSLMFDCDGRRSLKGAPKNASSNKVSAG